MMVLQENDLPRVVVSLDTLYVRHKKEIGMLLQDNHISHYAKSHYFVLKYISPKLKETERNWVKLSQKLVKLSFWTKSWTFDTVWFVFTVFKSSSVKNKPWLFKNLQRQSLLIRKYWDWWWIRIALFHAAFDNSCQDRKFQPRAALKLMVLLSLSTTFSTSYSPPENAQLSGRNQSPVMEIDLQDLLLLQSENVFFDTKFLNILKYWFELFLASKIRTLNLV